MPANGVLEKSARRALYNEQGLTAYHASEYRLEKGAGGRDVMWWGDSVVWGNDLVNKLFSWMRQTSRMMQRRNNPDGKVGGLGYLHASPSVGILSGAGNQTSPNNTYNPVKRYDNGGAANAGYSGPNAFGYSIKDQCTQGNFSNKPGLDLVCGDDLQNLLKPDVTPTTVPWATDVLAVYNNDTDWADLELYFVNDPAPAVWAGYGSATAVAMKAGATWDRKSGMRAGGTAARDGVWNNKTKTGVQHYAVRANPTGTEFSVFDGFLHFDDDWDWKERHHNMGRSGAMASHLLANIDDANIGGYIIDSMMKNFGDSTFCAHVGSEPTNLFPSLLIMDFGFNERNTTKDTNRTATPDQFERNLRRIIDRVLTMPTKPSILLCANWCMGDYNDKAQPVDYRWERYIEALYRIASDPVYKYHVALLDIFEATERAQSDAGGNAWINTYGFATVHPNPRHAAFLAKLTTAALCA